MQQYCWNWETNCEVTEAESGWHILKEGTPIQSGDIPYDVFSGWLHGGFEAYAVKMKNQAFAHGRWVAWARRTKPTAEKKEEGK